ncbi:hypothetical protein MLD38_006900 [Melastoma candidum]|nr:hypothetical protein MLD38_006900 [Melastoma candidum]
MMSKEDIIVISASYFAAYDHIWHINITSLDDLTFNSGHPVCIVWMAYIVLFGWLFGILPYIALEGVLPSFRRGIWSIGINAKIFRTNYAIVVLTILFLSLLWQPESLVVFVVAMIALLFLYFLCDKPLVVCGRLIEDRFVLMGLLLLGTVDALAFTNATINIIPALSIGFGVVIAHTTLMGTSDMAADEVGMSLGEAASDSYSVPYHLAGNSNHSNETA